jgi:hypothetical protein
VRLEERIKQAKRLSILMCGDCDCDSLAGLRIVFAVCRGRKENYCAEEKIKTVTTHAGEPANRIAMPFQKRMRPST